MTNLKMLDSHKQEFQLIEKYIKDLFDGESELRILEAGCGQKWPLDLNGIKYKLTGIDLDEEALKIRKNNRKDLDETIVADLQHFDLGNRNFDVIYNSFVLEHVENAELVLENLHGLLKSGGLLILRLPDRNTVFGFVTRTTPFWLHIAYGKYLKGQKNAGKPGFAPYPTYYNNIVSRDGIREFCESHNLIINEEYGYCGYLRKKNITVPLIRTFAIIVSIFSIGKLPWRHNNLTYILRKK